jgi:hypothetical protein
MFTPICPSIYTHYLLRRTFDQQLDYLKIELAPGYILRNLHGTGWDGDLEEILPMPVANQHTSA